MIDRSSESKIATSFQCLLNGSKATPVTRFDLERLRCEKAGQCGGVDLKLRNFHGTKQQHFGNQRAPEIAVIRQAASGNEGQHWFDVTGVIAFGVGPGRRQQVDTVGTNRLETTP